MLVQILVAAVDVYFIGRLGIDALAAIALVFPFQMLMMNIAMGGMGGSVAASMARALGAARIDDAAVSSCTRWSSPWQADWSSPPSRGRWRPRFTP
jgi:Na+-driven multidrug efflux pump